MEPLKYTEGEDDPNPEATRFLRVIRWKPSVNDTPPSSWQLLLVRAVWEVLERLDRLEEFMEGVKDA